MQNQNPNGAPKGVIFDKDGVILDTERMRQGAWTSAAKHYGYDLSHETFRHVIGKRKDDVVEAMREAVSPEFPVEDVMRVTQSIVEQIVSREGVPVKDGLFEILGGIERLALPKAIATSGLRPTTLEQLNSINITHRFNRIVCGDDVSKGKPDPEIFLHAAERLKIDPQNCIVLEDSENGVIAAFSAGMRVIHVRDILEPSDSIREMAEFLADSLDDAHRYLVKLAQG